MEKIKKQQLIATNLKYSSTAKSLKTLAYADLSAKALFLLGGNGGIRDISKTVASINGAKNISEDLIYIGLKELLNEEKITKIDKLYSLTEAENKKIKTEVSLFNVKLGKIVDAHFPKNIKRNKILAWFNDAIVDFFECNGDEWVESICKGSKGFIGRIMTIDEILDKSIKKHSLEKFSTELKESFRGTIVSEDSNDQNYLAGVGYAMFSARLVAADIGADPIALDELKNGIFLVDTNFLIASQLDNHRYADSMKTLGGALESINAKLIYISETKEEYDRVMAGRRAEIKNLFNIYPEQTVIEADNDFIKSAVARGARNAKDFDLFFQEISEMPKELLSGPKIELLDFSDINKEIEKAKEDEMLKNSIQRICIKFRHWFPNKKSIAALNHDASLIYVAEFERSLNHKAFVLTADRSLQACCSERVGSHSMPYGIYLGGLLQILAAYNAGPEFDSTNFAPLLSNILRKKCIPSEQTYTPQDLTWLYNIQKNIAQFSPEKIKTIVLEVTKARLAGREIGDEKLQRTINRLYQDEIKNKDQEVEELSNRAQEAEKIAEEEKGKRVVIEKKLNDQTIKEAKRNALKKLIVECLWRIPLSVLIIFVLYRLVILAIPNHGHESELLNFFLNVTLAIGTIYKMLAKPLKKYQNTKKSLIS